MPFREKKKEDIYKRLSHETYWPTASGKILFILDYEPLSVYNRTLNHQVERKSWLSNKAAASGNVREKEAGVAKAATKQEEILG